MKIDPKLEWIHPYLNEVGDLVDLKDIRRINISPVTERKKQRIHGEIIHLRWKKRSPRYDIHLALKYQKWKSRGIKGFGKVVGLEDFSAVDILCTLAHELAHLVLIKKFDDYEHTANHKIIECVILTRFMVKLNGDGYISEEFEKKILK